jgi:hypothetical protein
MIKAKRKQQGSKKTPEAKARKKIEKGNEDRERERERENAKKPHAVARLCNLSGVAKP